MFPYKGYTGKWLHVNLTTGRIEPHEYDAALAEGYLGGNGFGTRLLWEQVGPEVDPLAPESLLIFATGPLCGTLAPNAGRMEVIAKSPLTGIYGDANAGGFFGPELKFAGWDAVVVTGQAPHPVCLAIADERVELRDAATCGGFPPPRPKQPSAGPGETSRSKRPPSARPVRTGCISPPSRSLRSAPPPAAGWAR